MMMYSPTQAEIDLSPQEHDDASRYLLSRYTLADLGNVSADAVRCAVAFCRILEANDAEAHIVPLYPHVSDFEKRIDRVCVVFDGHGALVDHLLWGIGAFQHLQSRCLIDSWNNYTVVVTDRISERQS